MTSDRVDEALFEAGEPEVRARKKTPVGTSKTFGHDDPSQTFLLPPSLEDWLPDHEARFVAEVVDELLDLSAIYDSYLEASGAPPI